MLKVKVEPACLKYKDREKYICNEAFTKNRNNLIPEAPYSIYKDYIIRNMLELIEYCLHWGEDVEIPDNYKITPLYSIVFTTADFEPHDRTYSRAWSNVVLTTTDKKHAESVYEAFCKKEKRGTPLMKNVYCWHTEDIAVNQIIHSYSLRESYLVEKIK